MARRANKEDLAPVLDAFSQWINRCLIEGGSVFSTLTLWTPATVEEVRSAFVDHPDESKDDFSTKLKRQMADTSSAAKQLMAEMLWALLLFPANVKAATKREQVRDLWAQSGQQLRSDAPLLGDNALGGIGSGGVAFNTHRWRELVFLISIAASLAQKSTPERRQIFSDYDAFMAWMDTVPREGRRQFRHMLRFAAFPDRVERMCSNADRREILEAFGVASRKEALEMKDRELDDALFKLRAKLEAESPGAVLDFYEAPLRARWHAADASLQADLKAVLSGYSQARSKEPFNSRSPMFQRFKRLEKAFQSTEPVRDRTELKVKASAGAGNWATVPWIAFLDPRETTSTQRGVYCVYLFREDMSGVYLTFNQGVTDPTDEQGWKSADQFLRSKASNIRKRFPDTSTFGFATNDDIDLRTRATLGEMYEVSTIAYKFYEAGAVPPDEKLLEDLEHVLTIYDQYVADGVALEEPRAWIFQANPDYFDLTGALEHLTEMTWVIRQHGDSIRKGDQVFVWEAGKEAGVVALGTVLTDPAETPQLEDEKRFNISRDRFEGIQSRVRLRIDRVLSPRIERSALVGYPTLGSLGILTAPQGSNFRVTPAQSRALFALLNGKAGPLLPAERRTLQEVVEEFSTALRTSHLSFGASHDDVVRSFVASLATKRFAILTGLSGSGKTQLALRFGEWLGRESFLVLPVRPDWTGAEALFGYEDALQQAVKGRRAWYVPASLEFMLRALHDPHRPYLLLLDEMNLAHVERYFADVLSGMESDYECLPNLQQEDGAWRLVSGGSEKVRVPKNLFVVGTVNVDETTYMFSPKVLDRANTFEFRVGADDLVVNNPKPVPCAPGDILSVKSFLSIANDDGWHLETRAPELDVFADHLRTVHRLLSVGNFEFGHRVFYESTRFASLLAAAGDRDALHALDFQILQKVLPRLHGSRRRLEDTLRALARFSFDLSTETSARSSEAATNFDPVHPPEGEPRLPRSFDKARRMTIALHANQFVSFTE